MTTYKNFVTNLGDLSISGVERLYDNPPMGLSNADLPAQWVQFPSGEQDAMTFQAHGGWPTLRAQLIIATKSTILSTQEDNWDLTITMMDNVESALVAAVGTVVKGKLTWAIRPGTTQVGEHEYWSVIADVEGYG